MDHNAALVFFFLIKVTPASDREKKKSQKQNKLETSQRASTFVEHTGTNPDLRTYSLINLSVVRLDDATLSLAVSIRSILQVNNFNR